MSSTMIVQTAFCVCGKSLARMMPPLIRGLLLRRSRPASRSGPATTGSATRRRRRRTSRTARDRRRGTRSGRRAARCTPVCGTMASTALDQPPSARSASPAERPMAGGGRGCARLSGRDRRLRAPVPAGRRGGGEGRGQCGIGSAAAAMSGQRVDEPSPPHGGGRGARAGASRSARADPLAPSRRDATRRMGATTCAHARQRADTAVRPPEPLLEHRTIGRARRAANVARGEGRPRCSLAGERVGEVDTDWAAPPGRRLVVQAARSRRKVHSARRT